MTPAAHRRKAFRDAARALEKATVQARELRRKACIGASWYTPPMPNPICHFEIGGRDVNRLREFYGKLFDWTFEPRPDNSIHIRTGADIGGHFNSLGHEPEHYVTFYIMVEDVQKTLDAAVAAGGKRVVGPVDINFGIFGWIADPDGNIIGVYKDTPKK
jgi:predicted enzyme related to lactoylglutathione lyase